MSVDLHHGDCREVIKSIPDASIHAIVTDPPYSLVSIQKRFGKPGSAAAQEGTDGLYRRASAGFMGKQWDTGETAFDPAWWAEVLRVMKPGAHLVAFSGTRTYHRMTCAIEDAGFEIRDMLSWLYGSGFPKSHNQHGDWEGWGSALKPSCEPIAFARKPLIGTIAANLEAHRTGALNIDGCRIGEGGGCKTRGGEERSESQKGAIGFYASSPRVDGMGRWPANLCHDGSDEVGEAFAAFGESASRIGQPRGAAPGAGWGMTRTGSEYADAGSPARFFFSGKAGPDDRCDSKHPTVKPVALMRWLAKLVTPPGGTVLDPFAGSGTTGVACIREGFDCILIEREDEYVRDIRHRLDKLSGLDTGLFAPLKGDRQEALL